MKRAHLVLLLTLLTAPLAQAAGLVCRVPAVPDGSRVEMVAPDMRMNGVPMTIRAVEAPLKVEAMLGYYRALWAPLATPQRPGSMQQKVNGWDVISTVEGTCFTTVQVKAQGAGSYALVAVSQKPDASARRSTDPFPAPLGARLLNDFEYLDGVRNARTVLLAADGRVSSIADFYVNTFGRQGWNVIMRRQPENASGVSQVIALKRGLAEISLVISPTESGQISVLANVTDKP